MTLYFMYVVCFFFGRNKDWNKQQKQTEHLWAGDKDMTGASHPTPVLLPQRGAAPERVHAVHGHDQPQRSLSFLQGAPCLHTQLPQQRPHHITAAPHTSHSLGWGVGVKVRKMDEENIRIRKNKVSRGRISFSKIIYQEKKMTPPTGDVIDDKWVLKFSPPEHTHI